MTNKPRQPPSYVSRRNVMAIGVIAAAVGLPISMAAISRRDRSQAETSLLAVFRDSKAVAQLGDAVLGAWPHMSNRIMLLALILNDLGIDEQSAVRADVTGIAKRLSQRIRDDFSARRTVMLDGWVLSVTETRLYALAALAGA